MNLYLMVCVGHLEGLYCVLPMAFAPTRKFQSRWGNGFSREPCPPYYDRFSIQQLTQTSLTDIKYGTARVFGSRQLSRPFIGFHRQHDDPKL